MAQDTSFDVSWAASWAFSMFFYFIFLFYYATNYVSTLRRQQRQRRPMQRQRTTWDDMGQSVWSKTHQMTCLGPLVRSFSYSTMLLTMLVLYDDDNNLNNNDQCRGKGRCGMTSQWDNQCGPRHVKRRVLGLWPGYVFYFIFLFYYSTTMHHLHLQVLHQPQRDVTTLPCHDHLHFHQTQHCTYLSPNDNDWDSTRHLRHNSFIYHFFFFFFCSFLVKGQGRPWPFPTRPYVPGAKLQWPRARVSKIGLGLARPGPAWPSDRDSVSALLVFGEQDTGAQLFHGRFRWSLQGYIIYTYIALITLIASQIPPLFIVLHRHAREFYRHPQTFIAQPLFYKNI